MKINKIELYNIGSYEGYNVFDINGQSEKGKISVIGGKNGAGKTTLFSSIKLCLYGHKEAGYQAINTWYKNSIRKLINDKSKLENNANAYVKINLSIFNGQDWDKYELCRSWKLNSPVFEEFSVNRNNVDLSTEEIVDFDNYLLNIIPPELFEFYFFDGEQIADFFLEEGNSAKLKKAFLILCGYDTFDIMYRNFKRISKGTTENNTALQEYLEAEDALGQVEKKLFKCKGKITELNDEIINTDTALIGLENSFKSSGGVSLEEWNEKLSDIKNEERIREEKNAWIKAAVNDIIPYIILKPQLEELFEQMKKEQELEKNETLMEVANTVLPETLLEAKSNFSEISEELMKEIITLFKARISKKDNEEQRILYLSKDEYQILFKDVTTMIEYSPDDIIKCRNEIKKSIQRTQKKRDEIEKSNISQIDNYLKNKENLIKKKQEIIDLRAELFEEQKQLEEEITGLKNRYKQAEKALDKFLKDESISDLTTKSILFLDTLQRRLYETEIKKVEKLFMIKMNELMRKEKFISDIFIDESFNIHVYKQVRIESKGVCNKIKQTSIDSYIEEFGNVHCNDILSVSKCSSLDEFVSKYAKSDKVFDVVLEFDKSTMSKGEKQVFIMALYWAIMQLCNKEVPFIIDTPFARIDTEHRAHITEYFFKELSGQVLIFSTDEEITPEHMHVIGDDLQSKFLIENIDNKKTVITANRYFGE